MSRLQNAIEAKLILWHYNCSIELLLILGRRPAMDNLENIIYSLLPLILILVLSWLFSSLGSRTRKQVQEKEGLSGPLSGEQILDVLSSKRGETTSKPGDVNMGFPEEIRLQEAEPWMKQQHSAPTEVTPKPIKPKWWGA